MTDEYVEVPVTRRARISYVGKLAAPHRWTAEGVLSDTGCPLLLDAGTLLVLKPHREAPARGGFARVTNWGIDVSGVPAACDGDIVYRVERDRPISDPGGHAKALALMAWFAARGGDQCRSVAGRSRRLRQAEQGARRLRGLVEGLMSVINLRETIDPVLAEHYPGLDPHVRAATTRDGYEVTLNDGRVLEVDAAVLERAASYTGDRWAESFLRALFAAIDAALATSGPA